MAATNERPMTSRALLEQKRGGVTGSRTCAVCDRSAANDVCSFGCRAYFALYVAQEALALLLERIGHATAAQSVREWRYQRYAARRARRAAAA